MQENLNELIRTASNINTTFGEIVETGIEYAPYIGKLLQTVKLNRLIRRFNDHSKKIEKIGQLSRDSVLSEEYIRKRIFPIVLSDMFEEHEDAKINLLLTGFENVFIEMNRHESLVINYYDTLRSLRYSDIKRLYYFANIIKEYPFSLNESDDHVLQRSIDRKLESLGLIFVEKTWNDFGDETDLNRDRVKITLYGDRFLKFILEKDELEEYSKNKECL